MLSYIHWNASPEIFSLGPITVRWYGLLFATGFLLGQQVLIRMFKAEGKPEQDVETLTIYMVLSTIIGARLGHCLFYQPDYYLAHPIEILKIWEGGLASHGAGIAIFIALYFYARKKPDQSYLWVTDRMAVTVALAGCCIRLGNLMNSEIIGKQADVPWAFIFESVDMLPRHPAQLYEAISCFFLFFFLYWFWKRRKALTPEGSITGLFMIIVFTLRFFYEFLKEPQVDFEATMALNMGQLLSIPAVTFGVILLLYSRKSGKKLASAHSTPVEARIQK